MAFSFLLVLLENEALFLFFLIFFLSLCRLFWLVAENASRDFSSRPNIYTDQLFKKIQNTCTRVIVISYNSFLFFYLTARESKNILIYLIFKYESTNSCYVSVVVHMCICWYVRASEKAETLDCAQYKLNRSQHHWRRLIKC